MFYGNVSVIWTREADVMQLYFCLRSACASVRYDTDMEAHFCFRWETIERDPGFRFAAL